MTDSEASLLSIRGVEVVYEGIILALRGVSLEVRRGSVVALLGGNGAGKSTTLKAASALLAAERGAVTAGEIEYAGRSLSGVQARELVRDGLVQVIEGRRCFPRLTVEENLISGALLRSPSRVVLREKLDRVYTHFPRLRDRRRTLAGFTSGGEQQMTAIGRALMSEPKLVLLDEPSMGLAPLAVEEIFEIMRSLNRENGVSFLLAEQNATLALRYADFGYVLQNGRVASQGTARELALRPDVKQLYLGDRAAFEKNPRKPHAA